MLRLASLLCCCLLCCACTFRSGPPQPSAQVPRPSFSGDWEMDYGRSENAEEKLENIYREMQRTAERRASLERNRGQVISANINASRTFRNMVAAARLADMITRSQVLHIEQSDRDIEIRREDTFALNCVFSEGKPEMVVEGLGTESCRWEAADLVFLLQLPDNLDISHRITISPDGDQLGIYTTVDSGSAPPFTLKRFYFKFKSLPKDYSCEYTLSRGRVCQRSPS